MCSGPSVVGARLGVVERLEVEEVETESRNPRFEEVLLEMGLRTREMEQSLERVRDPEEF